MKKILCFLFLSLACVAPYVSADIRKLSRSERKERIKVRYRLGKFCAETGGNVYYIDQVADLHRIYDDIQNELRSQYILGFYPAETAKRDTKWHAVMVQVSDAKAKTIRGYYP